jgi:hypothetical protein
VGGPSQRRGILSPYGVLHAGHECGTFLKQHGYQILQKRDVAIKLLSGFLPVQWCRALDVSVSGSSCHSHDRG